MLTPSQSHWHCLCLSTLQVCFVSTAGSFLYILECKYQSESYRIDIRHHTQKQCSHISHPQSSIGHPGICMPVGTGNKEISISS